MTNIDSIKTVLKGFSHSRTRSALTMLGIVIGIASIIILMSLGASAQDLILNRVKDTGSDLIFIIPGGGQSSRFSPPSAQGIIIKTLVTRDAQSLMNEPSITAVAPQVNGIARVIYKNNDTNVSFQGVSKEFFTVRNFTLARGYAFRNEDIANLNHVAVIGTEIAKTLFGEQDPLGQSIRLGNGAFRIIGLFTPKGIGPFGVEQDKLVLVPISVAQKQLLGIDYYNLIIAQANSSYSMDFVKSRIESVLRQNHKIISADKDDFMVHTMEDAVAILGTITSVMTIFLTAIAMISLLVGGVGIMNIMLVSVIERTREIGLRKAVGATREDIIRQFLWESAILTMVGGIIGIATGAAAVTAAYFGIKYFAELEWSFRLPLSAIFLAFVFSAATGIIFGLYPAYKASQKSPIEALRYE